MSEGVDSSTRIVFALHGKPDGVEWPDKYNRDDLEALLHLQAAGLRRPAVHPCRSVSIEVAPDDEKPAEEEFWGIEVTCGDSAIDGEADEDELAMVEEDNTQHVTDDETEATPHIRVAGVIQIM